VQQLATGNWQLAKQKQNQRQKPKTLPRINTDLRGSARMWGLKYLSDSLNIRYTKSGGTSCSIVRWTAENAMVKEDNGKEKILAAIRRAAAELGRAPSRGELRRITGVSHYRVLAVFPTLREAVRAAGLEPNPKGERISTDDLLADWKRVAEKLGRRPSRAEYVREGRYSAGTLTVRFGSWGKIPTTEDAEKRSGDLVIGRSGDLHPNTRKPRVPGTPGDRKAGASRILSGAELHSHKRNERSRNSGESVLHNFQRVQLAAVPAPVVGMRRVTEAVAQMVVNTLLAPGNWQLAISQNQSPFTTEVTEEHGEQQIRRAEDVVNAQAGMRSGRNSLPPLRSSVSSVVKKDRPVMGEPFDRRPMTNAPVNELGVMVLFGMVAAGLGLQVESVQGKFPDCIAKRQVAPGKWQYLRIEFEYESKNFKLHGHDPKGCDMIVCWRHNWKDIPPDLEVIELSRLVGW
jgi:hypothetical protein